MFMKTNGRGVNNWVCNFIIGVDFYNDKQIVKCIGGKGLAIWTKNDSLGCHLLIYVKVVYTLKYVTSSAYTPAPTSQAG